jgi:hypothetical protein
MFARVAIWVGVRREIEKLVRPKESQRVRALRHHFLPPVIHSLPAKGFEVPLTRFVAMQPQFVPLCGAGASPRKG